MNAKTNKCGIFINRCIRGKCVIIDLRTTTTPSIHMNDHFLFLLLIQNHVTSLFLNLTADFHTKVVNIGKIA